MRLPISGGLLRYILPPTIKVDANLPTLSDHLKQYVKYDDLPIIIYLHGQDGTRYRNLKINFQIN
jgi:hypothetical protein